MRRNGLLYFNTVMLCTLLGACATKVATPPPDWINGKASDAFYYGVGGPAQTMDEAKDKARKDLAQSIEVKIEAEFISEILETHETFQKKVYDKSRSYTLQNLQDSEVVQTYTHPKTGVHYALARMKRQTVIERMEAPIRETERDVSNHRRRGLEAQANGQLIDALSEFGRGWQKALTLPQKYNWLNVKRAASPFDVKRAASPFFVKRTVSLLDEEKTERYSDYLEGLLNQLVRGISLRCDSEKSNGEDTITVIAELQLENGVIPLRQLPLLAVSLAGEQLRSAKGEQGSRIRLTTDANGQTKVFIPKRGKSIRGNRIRIALDEEQIQPIHSLIGGQRVSNLLEKAVFFSPPQTKGYRVAILPFMNLRGETEMDWIAKSLQDTFTNYLTQVNGIDEVLTRIAPPAILKELQLQMSDLIDPRTAARIGGMKGATHVVTGTYTPIQSELQISARLVNVESASAEFATSEKGEVIRAQGKLSADFFDLTNRLAYSLIIQLDAGLAEQAKTEMPRSEVRMPPTDLAREHFERALQFQSQGRFDEALPLYREGLKHDSSRAEAYNNLGICYRKLGRVQEAREAYETAIRLKPHFPEVYNNFGWLLLETGDVERAIDGFKNGLALAPKTRHIWTNLAWAYYVNGDYPLAIETNRAVLKEYPADLYARYNLALAYLCSENLDNAEREYKAAYNLTSRPDEPAYVSAVNDLHNLLKHGTRPRESQGMLELLQWRK